MTYTVYRIEHDGTETVVACVDGIEEACIEIEADMRKIDYSAGYRVELDGDWT